MLLGIFVLLIFAAKTSGAHFNPAITLAFMLRKETEGRFSRPLGLAYIIFQMAGGFLGGMIGSILTTKEDGLGVDDSKFIPQAMAAEAIGAFFVAFLYLTQTEHKTKLSNDPAITTMIIASSYLAAMLMVCGPDSDITPLNPAVALGTIFQQFMHGNADAFVRLYIYLGFPLLGGVAAVAFHELVYKRVSETIQESEETDGVLDKGDEEDVVGIQNRNTGSE